MSILATVISKKIFLIRHCDKHNDNSNPCCSNTGYDRVKNWNLFFNRYSDRLKIYTSPFKEEKMCNNYKNYDSIEKKGCQKSQRMYLTAHIIHEKLNLTNSINSDFCDGEYKKLVNNIKQNKHYEYFLLIREHIEIIEIIRNFDINIQDWTGNKYNIVFLIDTDKNELFYTCFHYKSNKYSCSKKINKWLTSYTFINSESSKETIKKDNFNIVMKIGFFSILTLSLYLIVKKCFHDKRKIGYTVII